MRLNSAYKSSKNILTHHVKLRIVIKFISEGLILVGRRGKDRGGSYEYSSPSKVYESANANEVGGLKG